MVWVDHNIFATTRKLGKTIVNIFTESTIKLVTLHNITDLKKFYKHLFLIRYEQRTEDILKEYCIVIFNDFHNMREVLDFSDLVEYFEENDIFIHTAIYSETIDKNALSLLRKVDDRFVLLSNSHQLTSYIRDPDENKEKLTANSDFNETEHNSYIE